MPQRCGASPMRKSVTFFSFACIAAAKQAGRTRRAFVAGKMSEEEFRARRERQERVSHNRIETVMARTIPHYQPRFI